MDKRELADKFLAIDLEPLDYISQIIIDFGKCRRDKKTLAGLHGEIMSTLNEVINIQLEHEDNQD